jgi:hypothetical protein
MIRFGFRSSAVALLATVAVSAATPLMTSTYAAAVKRIMEEISLRSDVALILGGTRMPIPTQAEIDEVNDGGTTRGLGVIRAARGKTDQLQTHFAARHTRAKL